MKKIAFFDFDGTLTTADTMMEIIKFHFGRIGFLRGTIRLVPWLLGLKLKIFPAQPVKEKLLKHFWGGMDEKEFEIICKDFFKNEFVTLTRKEALNRIAILKNEGFEIAIVTASPVQWVRYWAEDLGVALIATPLEVKDGKITGKLAGTNCNYMEKVIRIRKQYNLSEYSEIHGYGDSKGDKEMLSLATHPFYRIFM